MDKQLFIELFGMQCKSARKRMGISQKLAAEKMNIDYRHYQNIESGKVNFRIDTLAKVVNFYDFEYKFGEMTCS